MNPEDDQNLISPLPSLLLKGLNVNTRKRRRTAHLKCVKKIRFEIRFSKILLDSYNNPSNVGINGAFFIDNEKFAVNSKILSNRMSIKTNSLIKDFRYLEIECIKRLPKELFSVYPDPKNWKVYQHSKKGFTLNKIINNVKDNSKDSSLNWNENIPTIKRKQPNTENQNNELPTQQKKVQSGAKPKKSVAKKPNHLSLQNLSNDTEQFNMDCFFSLEDDNDKKIEVDEYLQFYS